MKFFRRSTGEAEQVDVEAVPAPEPTPTLRRAEPGDAGHGAVMASLELAPGPQREARAAELAAAMDPEAEHWVLDGLDGTPVAALTLTPDADVLTVAGGVDPVMRRFGVGGRLLGHAMERAREHGLARLRCVAAQQSAYSFLLDKGFVAVATDGPRVTAELPVPPAA